MRKALDVRNLMQCLHTAHLEFQRACQRQDATGDVNYDLEPVVLRRRFCAKRQRLFAYLEALDQRFRQGEEPALDEVIHILTMDIPVVGCGFLKEKWLRRLKTTSLSEAQKQRLAQAAITLCASPHYRREITEWNRLMIKLANPAFIQRLCWLSEAPDQFVKGKAKRMIYVILNSRRDVVSPSWLQSALLWRRESER